jgi:hypothetical protein
MPRYREMISVFREKMWLADPETRKFFSELVEFVDVWDKILDNHLPRAVAPEIGQKRGCAKTALTCHSHSSSAQQTNPRRELR